MSFEAPRGVIAPILTPFNDDLSIATDLYVELAHKLLEDGCAGLAPFGTTGEALSVGIDERIAAVRALIDSGIDPAVLIPGTGLSNVADTARLSRACLDMGCLAVMTLPPFYFKNVSEDGIYRYFAELVAKIGENARIFLYHIPPVAIVGIPPALAARLYSDFPGQIVGIKDSSGDWDNTYAMLERRWEDFRVFVGSESFLLANMRNGGAGCISATANVNPAAIDHLYQHWQDDDADTLQQGLDDVRDAVMAYPMIPALKATVAEFSGDDAWRAVRPPLVALDTERSAKLAEILRGIGFEMPGLE